MALARLQQPQAAQHVLESALASLDPEVIKTRPRLMAALATAHVRQGNTTKRVTLGPKPSTLPPASRSRPTSKTYDGYASTWEPWRTTQAVKELDEQLALVGWQRAAGTCGVGELARSSVRLKS